MSFDCVCKKKIRKKRKVKMCLISVTTNKNSHAPVFGMGMTMAYQKKDEINPLTTFHRFIRSIAAVIIMVTDEAQRDACFVVTAK